MASTQASGASFEALQRHCHTLLLADRYNPSVVLSPLEEALNSQCNDGWYDAELNTALMKLYQMFPHEVEKVAKVDVVIKILLKAMMQLPEPDLTLLMFM